MEKTILLLFTLLLVNISAIAQCNQRPNADHYLLQGNMYLHADEIDLDAFDSDGRLKDNLQFGIGILVSSTGVNEFGEFCIHDIAQLQYCGTLYTVVGVSALLTRHYYGTMNAYLCIADSNFNIYRRAKIPSADTLDCNYTELFFEQPINVNGKFSIIWDNPKPGNSPDIYNFDSTFDLAGDNKARLVNYNISKDTNNSGLYIKSTCGDYTSEWTYYFGNFFTSHLSSRTVAYLFPIFGDLDTTLSCVGQLEDTISQTDTSSIAIVNVVEKYSNIFPNPAKEELNVQSSFKIKDVEIYNSLGQKVLNKEVNKYNATLKIDNLQKGNYIIKINTLHGTTYKKFIRQ